ncbi:LysM peptidoglycan-binding domain-containing protein [Mesorhizobium sp. IMUNJ 23232]|uniref:LysM peptidoglycan-binding domain-containing protein n=1 Tax=Mesorhizobium sp. IMUNJ 23232 TaxID=3376064 RepID=UPI0037B4A05B
MALTPIKALLFLAGGSAAVGGTAYVAGVFDPQMNPPAVVDMAPAGQKVAALPPADAPSGQGDAPSGQGETSTTPTGDKPAVEAPKPPASDAPAAATPAAPEQQAALPPAAEQPKADAPGPAAAGTNPQPTVEAPTFDLVRVEADGSIVIAGHAAPDSKVEAIIGSRVIGSAMAGPGGDFAIVLDEPLKPGDYQIVLRSTTADNVVAMSTETAVVSIPDSPDGQVLALVEEPGKPAELITVPEPKQAKPSVASAAGDSGTPAAGSETPAAATPPPASDEKPAPQQQAAADAGASDQPAADFAAKDKAAADTTAKQQPAASKEKPAAETTATGEPAAPEQKPAIGGEQQVAVATPDTAPAKPEQQPASKTKVAVEAVEIEGRRIFVAGRADPGRTVRGYANEILLGDAKTSQEGRFLIEAERDLPVGDYIIRVDALGPDGAEVVARAAVPFEREAGDNVAAVAAPASQPAGETVAAGPQDRVGNAPSSEAGQAAKPSATAATQDQPAADAPKPSEKPAAIAAAPAASPASGEPAPKPADASATQPAPNKPAEIAAASVEQPAQPAAGTDAAAKPADALSPKLQSVDGSVIIRRGDSLWRISRRVYGHGLRYSTIYLANQHQIDDPDRIYPGQVFSVPSKTERGEEADLTTLGEQAISPVVRQ